MVFKELKGLYTMIRKIVRAEVDSVRKPFDLFVVVSTNPENYTVDIRNYWQGRLQFNDVQVAGLGLGNFDGIVKMPRTNDLVIVGYLSDRKPIVLGSLYTPYNNLNITEDVVPRIKEGETLIIGTAKNSYIYFNENGKIKIKNDNGKMVVNADGQIDFQASSIEVLGKINASTDSIMIQKSSGSVSDPPLETELNDIFGEPATAGTGFTALVGTYIVWSTGSEWKYVEGTTAG